MGVNAQSGFCKYQGFFIAHIAVHQLGHLYQSRHKTWCFVQGSSQFLFCLGIHFLIHKGFALQV
ncbi:hypothetical protein D3C86_1766580 [compost metagenome]